MRAGYKSFIHFVHIQSSSAAVLVASLDQLRLHGPYRIVYRIHGLYTLYTYIGIFSNFFIGK